MVRLSRRYITRSGSDGGLAYSSSAASSSPRHQLLPQQQQQRSSGSFVGFPWERLCILLLLMLAWSWIMVTFGMVFYHGYYKKQQQGSSSSSTTATGGGGVLPQGGGGVLPFIPGKNPPPNFQQQQQPQQQGGGEGGGGASGNGVLEPYESPLLIFTCNRDNYLRETLEDVFQYLPRDDSCRMGCPVIVSQDGSNAQVTSVILEYQTKFRSIGIPLMHLQHKSSLRGAAGGSSVYKALAVHYGWALGQVFDQNFADNNKKSLSGMVLPPRVTPQRVVILEEDLHIAPDFFSYFQALAPILNTDPTLLAVSAFNDNGFQHHVSDPKRVLRSDFFPGLGWMMTRKLWTQELKFKWPGGYWDDWLREPAQRQDRHILRPEISRTFHLGVKGGASGNQFGGKLSSVYLNPTHIDWSKEDLSYLRVDEFDRNYWRLLHSARHVESIEEALEWSKTSDVQLEYNGLDEFKNMAKDLGIMDDEKAGTPRTAYKGVVEFRPHADSDAANAGADVGKSYILFLTPPIRELQEEFSHVL